jgi:hypothetical protein
MTPQEREQAAADRNLTHAGIGPAPAEKPGVVHLELRTADSCWNIPVTLDDLREIHEVTGEALPVWQAVKDIGTGLAATHEGRAIDPRNNIPAGEKP